MASAAEDRSKPAATGFPPAAGYTQQYPGYPPPYQGYPPAYPGHPYPPNPYPYTAAPPAAYYSQQQYLPAEQEPSARRTFFHFILATMTILVVGAFVMSLLTWFIFGADIPVFSVQSLAVPSFNATNTALKATWDADIAVKNSNSKLDVFFERLEGVIIYDDTVLALSAVQPFHVGTKQEAMFNIKLSSTNTDQESRVGDHQNLVRDRSKGEVNFSLRMIAATTFTSGPMWRRQANLRVFCDDLQVQFSGPAGPGTLVGKAGKEQECLIYA